eukprot:6444818-Heterocapsa_arctica.AAC.1
MALNTRRGKPISYVKNTISAPQDKSDGSAITSELRTQQKKLSILKKYNILLRKDKELSVEGLWLKRVIHDFFIEDITKHEDLINTMKADIKHERSNRWRHWVEHAWEHKNHNIYRWIRGKQGNGPLIVIPGGSAHISDRLTEDEKAWGGLWAVDAEELPVFDKQPMDLISEDENTRVIN